MSYTFKECGAVLSLHLPESVCLKLLLSVIDDENTPYHQLAGAIKMLGEVLKKIPPDEERTLLPQIVPRMMKVTVLQTVLKNNRSLAFRLTRIRNPWSVEQRLFALSP